MKVGPVALLSLILVFGLVLPAFGQAEREDVVWARRSLAPITLDGVLDEPAWLQAEEVVIEWHTDAGIPGSGWKIEPPIRLPSDPSYATLKFLVEGNQLYLGAVVEDQSVGGSPDFNRFDGFLMAIKDHADPNAPKPPAEYFYAWWYPEDTAPLPPGQDPAFIGRWAEWPPGTPRTPEQIANWDAVTIVDGLSNDDGVADIGYTVEMRFNLTPMGYDVTAPGGDIVEWNISIYDCDWLWPLDGTRQSSNRVWFQGPWGNAAWYNEVRVHADPDVTTASGLVPPVGPEVVIPAWAGAAPVIDGTLSEAVWNDPSVYSFDIRYGDDALRQTYPSVGPYRAGQYQPEVNGGQAFILDPADATVKMFYKDTTLYMGFDVRDQVVQYVSEFDRWDGFLITPNERFTRGPDNQLIGRRLAFQVNEDGTALAQDYLLTLVDDGDAEVAIALNPGTTVDTLGMQPDNGYTAELAVDLRALSYPPNLSDGTFFIAVTLLDGDSFTPFTDSYGTRTWWFREYEGDCCPAWAWFEGVQIGIADPGPSSPQAGYALVKSYPNPAARATIRYGLPEPNRVTLEVFDVTGRLVERRELGLQAPGLREVLYDGGNSSGGVYLYRLKMSDPESGALRTTLNGKFVLLK